MENLADEYFESAENILKTIEKLEENPTADNLRKAEIFQNMYDDTLDTALKLKYYYKRG